MPKFQVLQPGIIHQADLLYLPNDDGYKYLLVVVDDNSRKIDVEPLKAKDAQTVAEAFKSIYERPILDIPKIMEVDAGTEFKGEVMQFFKAHKVNVRVAKVARHRQQAIVERFNQIISVELFKVMIDKQIETDKLNSEWVDNLDKVVKKLNAKRTKPVKYPTKSPTAEGDSAKLLSKGDKVRAILEQPKESTGEKLGGKFRSIVVRPPS